MTADCDEYYDDPDHQECYCPHGVEVPVLGGACYWCVQEDMDDD